MSENKKTFRIKDQKRKEAIEERMRAIIATQKEETMIVITFGINEYRFDGDFALLQKFLDASNLDKLKGIKRMSDKWYNWEWDEKNLLLESFNTEVSYVEDLGALGSFEVKVCPVKTLEEALAREFVTLQAEYKSLVEEVVKTENKTD
jgi:hypothetical protein